MQSAKTHHFVSEISDKVPNQTNEDGYFHSNSDNTCDVITQGFLDPKVITFCNYIPGPGASAASGFTLPDL